MKHLLVLIAFIPLAVFSQNLSADKSLEKILSLPDKEAIKSRIKFLSDDKLQGRRASSPGYKMAVDYVVDQFSQLGIAPKGDDGYLQKVTIRTGKLDSARTSLVFNGKTLQYGAEYIVLPDMNNTSTDFQGEVVFIGQGIFAPHLGHDDYAGIDVKGKVAMLIASMPENFPPSERAHFSSTAIRAELAAVRGAVGAIAINTIPRQFNSARSGAASGIQGIVNRDGRISARSGVTHHNMKFYAVGKDTYFNPLIENLKRGDKVGTVSVKSFTTYTEFVSYNVIGVISGTDKKLKNEYVIHTAHLDHLGIRAKINGDSIYNGAHDNASGVACALEIAKLYTKIRIKRSVLIALVTGEEMGIMGSSFLAANPPVPRQSIVADINNDMPTLIAPLLSIEPLGAWNSSLMNEVSQVAKYLDLEIQPDHVPEQVRFTRSDQYSFIREGIPALAIKYGLKTNDPSIDVKKMIDDWTKDHYHKPSDQYHEDFFNWDAAITYVKLNFLVGYLVANNPQRPAWNKGDFFGETFGNVK